jgi:hypothetical protein
MPACWVCSAAVLLASALNAGPVEVAANFNIPTELMDKAS